MSAFGITPSEGLQIGMYSLGDHWPDPTAGTRASAQELLHDSIAYPQPAESAGFDFFSIGESHQEGFATQAHAVVLGAIAQATKSIRIGSTSTIVSTSDPVRVYENFATIDLISHGRAEDRKSTRLNSSHVAISYAVFCLKKKNTTARPDS